MPDQLLILMQCASCRGPESCTSACGELITGDILGCSSSAHTAWCKLAKKKGIVTISTYGSPSTSNVSG